MQKYGQVAAILILSQIVNRSQQHWVTDIGQVVFSETVVNCTALRVVRHHVSEQREQRASNFQNISIVSLIFINNKCFDLLRPGSKGKFLYLREGKLDSLLDLLLAEMKTNITVQVIWPTFRENQTY
jgi:hypothetical protein